VARHRNVYVLLSNLQFPTMYTQNHGALPIRLLSRDSILFHCSQFSQPSVIFLPHTFSGRILILIATVSLWLSIARLYQITLKAPTVWTDLQPTNLIADEQPRVVRLMRVRRMLSRWYCFEKRSMRWPFWSFAAADGQWKTALIMFWSIRLASK
jgi:hypothetical protein